MTEPRPPRNLRPEPVDPGLYREVNALRAALREQRRISMTTPQRALLVSAWAHTVAVFTFVMCRVILGLPVWPSLGGFAVSLVIAAWIGERITRE